MLVSEIRFYCLSSGLASRDMNSLCASCTMFIGIDISYFSLFYIHSLPLLVNRHSWMNSMTAGL